MVLNGSRLLHAAPIRDMAGSKIYGHGVSHGLGEAGYDICIKQSVRFTRSWFGRRDVEVLERTNRFAPVRGRFTIASAVDYFAMPTDVMGTHSVALDAAMLLAAE